MGYRSDGGIVLYGPKDLMLANLTQLKINRTNDEPWQECGEISIYEDGQGNLVWHLEYSDWKWYESYSDVAEFERIYRESLPGIYGYRWRFGEEENDIDYEVRDPGDEAGGRYEDLSIYRSANHRYENCDRETSPEYAGLFLPSKTTKES